MTHEIEIQLRTRVVLIEDTDGRWFARGLDIDYAAQGRSELEVQKAFEIGFVATVRDHMATYGHLDYFQRPAPDHVLEMYASALSESEDGVFLPLNAQPDTTRLARIEYLAA
jgi:hypothetical protein